MHALDQRQVFVSKHKRQEYRLDATKFVAGYRAIGVDACDFIVEAGPLSALQRWDIAASI